ncbi:MAG: hypothetical protein N2482_01650 [Patescibacteria group bacterium]|nr:hypothetical protein [Patescibacteria group bacterium]
MLYLRKEDFSEDTALWDIFAGKGGFFEILTKTEYENADNFYTQLGAYNKAASTGNLFFKMAEVWYLRNDDLNPFPSDIAYYDIFKHIPFSGENALKRLIDADWATYKDVVTQVPQLEKILLKAANTGDFKEIYELHQKIFNTLSGLVGTEHAYKANYILSQIVIQFFMEHSVLRDPIYNYLAPVNFVMRALIGKNRSLSRLLTGNIHAYSMDANAIRDYLIKLGTEMHVINQKGIYSAEQLEKVFEVTKGEFILGDVAPKLAWFIIIFLMWTYIKKALEEAEGKKK